MQIWIEVKQKPHTYAYTYTCTHMHKKLRCRCNSLLICLSMDMVIDRNGARQRESLNRREIWWLCDSFPPFKKGIWCSWLCVYVYVYVCLYTYKCVRVWVCIYMCIHIYTCVHIDIYTLQGMHIYIHTYTYLWICTHAHTYIIYTSMLCRRHIEERMRASLFSDLKKKTAYPRNQKNSTTRSSSHGMIRIEG